MNDPLGKPIKKWPLVIFQLGHALFWAGVMLVLSWVFRDDPITKDLILWLPLGYVLLNGALLAIFFGKRFR